jgi:phosphoglycerate dehydrogenase-like enzyme
MRQVGDTIAPMRVMFCGTAFPAARQLLRDRLHPTEDEVCEWSGAGIETIPAPVDVIIPLMFRIDAPVMDASRARLIHQWGSGLEGVEFAAARSRSIYVANVPTSGDNAESVAEHAILLLLSVLRQAPAAEASVRSGLLGTPIGRMLAGNTVCLYGLGHVALALARRLRPFDVRLIGITRNPDAEKVAAFQLAACYATRDRMPALQQTNILIPCTPLSDATRDMIDAGALARLPRGAYLVNVARGGLVNYEALFAALASGHLAGAGLDVYWREPIAPDDPLLALPNVIATPHIAGVTDRSYSAIADAVAANIERLRRREPPLNRVV